MFQLGRVIRTPVSSLCNQILSSRSKRTPFLAHTCAMLMTHVVSEPVPAQQTKGIIYLYNTPPKEVLEIYKDLKLQLSNHVKIYESGFIYLAVAMMISILTRILSSSLIDIICCLPTERGEMGTMLGYTF